MTKVAIFIKIGFDNYLVFELLRELFDKYVALSLINFIMIISKGNIVFKRLISEDIELVRKWRNSAQITRAMVYREHITREMQKEWFRSIDNKFNLYFIIIHKGKKIGMINGKDINWEKKTMETGVFFWDKNTLKSHIPILCTLAFAELGIMVFGLTAYAKIRKDNNNAKRYNKLLGFEICEDNEDIEYQLYRLNEESYLKKAKILRKAFLLVAGKSQTILHFEKPDYDCGIAQLIENNIPVSILQKSEDVENGKIYYF